MASSGDDDAERPDIAELLPVDKFHAFLELAPAGARVVIAAEEDVEPALRDHWQDVCTAFHDQDAHDLYINPDRVLERGYARVTARLGGQTLSSADAARGAAALVLRFADGSVDARVERGGARTYDRQAGAQPTLL